MQRRRAMAMTENREGSLKSIEELFGDGRCGEEEIVVPNPTARHPRMEPIPHPADGNQVGFGFNHLPVEEKRESRVARGGRSYTRERIVMEHGNQDIQFPDIVPRDILMRERRGGG
jgi:hypothetical protein